MHSSICLPKNLLNVKIRLVLYERVLQRLLRAQSRRRVEAQQLTQEVKKVISNGQF